MSCFVFYIKVNFKNIFLQHVTLYVQYNWHNTLTVLFPVPVPHDSQVFKTHEHVWSWTVVPAQRFQRVCQLFDRHQNCTVELSFHFSYTWIECGLCHRRWKCEGMKSGERGGCVAKVKCLLMHIVYNHFFILGWGIHSWICPKKGERKSERETECGGLLKGSALIVMTGGGVRKFCSEGSRQDPLVLLEKVQW